jgi:hypothetical protein
MAEGRLESLAFRHPVSGPPLERSLARWMRTGSPWMRRDGLGIAETSTGPVGRGYEPIKKSAIHW